MAKKKAVAMQGVTEPSYYDVKEAARKAQDYEDFVADLGNTGLKGMKGGRIDTKRQIAHAVQILPDSDLDKFMGRMQGGLGRNQDGQIFTLEYKDKDATKTKDNFRNNYVVGAMAENGAYLRKSSDEKYPRYYYAALLVAQLLEHYPDGHENLRVMATFPPSDYRYKSMIENSLGGKHVVTKMNGEKVIYRVRRVHLCDEPVGGLCNYVMHSDGVRFAKKHIDKRDRILTIDIGGRISSMATATLNDGVDYTPSKTFSENLGIQDVMATMSDLLLSTPEYEKYFRGFRGTQLPQDEAMREALKTGIYFYNGYEISAIDALAQATGAIRQLIRDAYMQRYNGGGGFRHIIITGGGGALLYTQLVEHVLSNFNPERIYKSHEFDDEMHFANMLGADKVLTSIIQGNVKGIG